MGREPRQVGLIGCGSVKARTGAVPSQARPQVGHQGIGCVYFPD